MKLSVVIPVYNEELSLPFLFERLYPALDALGLPQPFAGQDDKIGVFQHVRQRGGA